MFYFHRLVPPVLQYSLFHLPSRYNELPDPSWPPLCCLPSLIKHFVQQVRVGHLGFLHGKNSHGKQAVW